MPTNDKIREIASLMRGVLLTVALKTDCQYTVFNQYLVGHEAAYDRYIGKGICHGISMTALGLSKQNQDIRAYFNNGTMHTNFDTAQHQEMFRNTTIGNTRFSSKEYQFKHMRETYGLNHQRTAEFKPSTWSYSRAGSFISQPGYYMISSEGHAMGAISKAGWTTFIEPNCGIVNGPSKKMSTLFSRFFGHSFVKDKYGHGHKIKLTIERYV